MHIIFFLLLLLCHLPAQAQTVIRGTVSDSLNGERLPGVSVTLIRGGRPLVFTRSDGQGAFKLHVACGQSGDSLQATCLGYRKQRFALSTGPTTLRLVPQAFTLKEVNIKGAPVFGRQDTVTYDLERFATDRDNTLKDVLRKLPGIDVDEAGRISYNGKNISRFTVEGLDLTGGRYNQLEESLKAKDVKKAEIIEHDQPLKALRNKVFTDDVAMNIGLKDEARDQLMPTLKPYLFIGDPVHAGGSANVVQIGKRRQWMYDAANDRTGRDLSVGMTRLAYYGGQLEPLDMPSWISMSALETPIDADRLRFNTSQKYGVNRVEKGEHDQELRLSANYLHTHDRQAIQNRSQYDLGGAAPVMTGEDRRLQLWEDQFVAEIEHKVNEDRNYGNERIEVMARQQDAMTDISDTLRQRMRLPEVNVVANIYRLFSRKSGQWVWKTVADYHHSVSDLYVNVARLRLRNNLWHTAHQLGWISQRGSLTHNYRIEVEADNLNVGEDNPRLGLSLLPALQYEHGKTVANLSSQLTWQYLQRRHQWFFLPAPSLYIDRKVGHHSEWSLWANYKEQIGDMSQYVLADYRMDYRSYYAASGVVPKVRNLYGNVEYHYKRTIRELFLNGSLAVSRTWRNATPDLQIIGGNYYTRQTDVPSMAGLWQVTGGVAKGFYQLHLKTRINGSYSYLKGEQLSAGQKVTYRLRVGTLSPSLEYASAWGAVSYLADFNWQQSGAQGTLFNWKQTLSLSATIGPVDLSGSMVHYSNQLQTDRTIRVLLADAKAVWRMKHLRLAFYVRNLFDKMRYEQTNYAGAATFTNIYHLRGRELVATAEVPL